MRLHRDRFPGRPILDTAVSHAMLRRVAEGRVTESLRLYSPDNALLFSSLDARKPGYARAVELALEGGFDPVIRLAGGHAAVFLESSMAFAWATPDENAQQGIRSRFETLSGWVVSALKRLGLDARLGAVPGEYCPGEFSVNLGGRIKVMGVGQRVIRGAAHVGGVLTVAQTDELREVLIPIYQALEIDFRPETAGGVADERAALRAEDVIEAMSEVLGEAGHQLEATVFDPDIETEAEQLVPLHTPGQDPKARTRLRPSLRASQAKVLAQTEGSLETKTAIDKSRS